MVAYAWEPVLVKAARKPVVRHRIVMRDFIAEPISNGSGIVNQKLRCGHVIAILWLLPGLVGLVWAMAYLAKEFNVEHSRRLECEELLIRSAEARRKP